MAIARYPSFVIDCSDPTALAEFYGQGHCPVDQQERMLALAGVRCC